MGESEKFMILVPAAVTVLVVILVENTYNVRGGVAPFVHQVVSDIGHFFGEILRSVKG